MTYAEQILAAITARDQAYAASSAAQSQAYTAATGGRSSGISSGGSSAGSSGMLAAARQAASQNLALSPAISSAALNQSLVSGNALSAAQEAAYYQNLDTVMPGWRNTIAGTQSTLNQATSTAGSLLSGSVPQDVQDAIFRARAELGIQRGLFGEVNQFATARDIGLTSMDLVQRGLQAIAQTVTPLTTALINGATQLMPTPIDYGQLYSSAYNTLASGTMVSPTTIASEVAAAQRQNAHIAWENQSMQFQAQQQQQNLMTQLAYSAAQFTASRARPSVYVNAGRGSIYTGMNQYRMAPGSGAASWDTLNRLGSTLR